MGHWKAHETEITNLYFHESRYLCSVADNQISLWGIDTPGFPLEAVFKGPSDVVAIAPFADQLFSVENSNYFSTPALDFSVLQLLFLVRFFFFAGLILPILFVCLCLFVFLQTAARKLRVDTKAQKPQHQKPGVRPAELALEPTDIIWV